jgi:5-methyltetrahydropteroyltriglutamate--homocysteine methyltransferase
MMVTRYRADQVGSFLRPRELLDAHARGAGADELKAIEDKAILDVLQKQKELGFKIFSDGELRRTTFMSDFNESVEGVASGDAVARQWSGQTAGNLGVATGKIKAKKRMTAHEMGFMRQHSPGDIKMTLPSANQFPAILYKKGLTDAVYANHSELLWDCVPVVAAEVAALANEGAKYIQLDAPRYSYYIDPKWRQYIKDEMGMDPDAALDEAIRADNTALESLQGRDDIVACIHLCRGNNRSQWYAEGGYDPIAEKLFNELKVDAFSLEYETERSGTFEPLRFVPKGKTVVLGLVSSKVPELEDQDMLVRRIEEAAKYMPLEDLTISPQCGFASMMEGNLISHEEQWAKLKLVADTAVRVWGTT